jgi:hypothetical protein
MKERIMSKIREIYQREIKDRDQLFRRLRWLLRGAWGLSVAGITSFSNFVWSATVWWWKLYFTVCVGLCGAYFGLYALGSSHAGHALQGVEVIQFIRAAFQWVTAGWR